MLGDLIVAIALTTATPGVSAKESPSPQDLKAYETAKGNVGRDPAAHVRLALWCEARGLRSERLKHLTLAVLSDPKNVTARGLLGLVAYQGKWQHPDAVSDKLKTDDAKAAVLREYSARRLALKNNAEAHWKLALWCEENDLKPEATAHFTAVTRLDPAREGAWKRLGFRKKSGRWVSEAMFQEEKAEAEQQKQADRYWKPLLAKWRSQLVSKARRAGAEAALLQVTDPRAVPAIVAVFASGNDGEQARAVKLLGQIDAAGASRALTLLALFGRTENVRRTATEILKRRDVREFADILIGFLRDPVKFQVQRVEGPGSPGELFIEGKQANLKRTYSSPSGPNLSLNPGDQIFSDDNGLPVLSRSFGPIGQTSWILASDLFPTTPAAQTQAMNRQLDQVLSHSGMNAAARHHTETILTQAVLGSDLFNPLGAYQRMIAPSLAARPANPTTSFTFTLGSQVTIPIGQMELEAQKTAAVAQQQLQNDVEALERYNAPIRQLNARVLPILQTVSNQQFGEDRDSWKKWWIDQLGFTLMPQKYSDKTTIIEDVPLAYQPQPVPITALTFPIAFERMSCFGAGTLVRTLAGLRPIESLEIGDQVLTQDIKTGALRYQPILVVHHNPPSATFKVGLGEETIVSSHFHRFWKAGQGWVMARDLKIGDTLRTLEGLSQVTSIEAGDVQPVFNLDVAEDADFFVGQQGALVHDNTLPDLRLAPFDAPVASTTSASTPR